MNPVYAYSAALAALFTTLLLGPAAGMSLDVLVEFFGGNVWKPLIWGYSAVAAMALACVFLTPSARRRLAA